ncbi:E3 SUMO-protein ligase ZBED1-like [Chelmon rostratus]|uniref:E3 SUMO-protein ligase ZBED1-like n=1 Tax=Chelmon rostratus TaxID=109905 RepID=UPI001BE5FA24|nr:E3 SUMO-protein ligase ZBED1-like [Chelmon rostratus]
MAPINTVNNEAFKEMIKTLDKRYEMPSRNYFSKVALPALYKQCREEIRKEIADLPFYATTTDLWSSRTMEPYMSLTIHYIDEDFEIKTRCLQTSFFPEDHTGEAIAQGLVEALASWDLQQERLVCITTDNGTNVVKAAALNQWTRLQCFGHRLHLAIDRKARTLIPTWQDTEVLESINQALQPLLEFTDALSSEKYVSISFVKPVLHLFSTSILKTTDDATTLTNTIKTKILTYLEEKYQDPETQELLDMASAVNPRFKMRYVNENRIAPIQARLISEMVAPANMEMGPTDPCGGTTGNAEDGPSGPKRRKTLGSFFKGSCGSTSPNQEQQTVASELQAYLQCASLDSENDPLDWWKEHGKLYPRVSKLAKKYLCIPATSSPSERVFSTGGNVVTCHRASLKPEHVDRLVFLAKNL